MHTRRSVLAALAAVGGLAGCNEESASTTSVPRDSTIRSEPGSTVDGATSESDPNHPPSGEAVTVGGAWVQSSILYLKSADQMGVIRFGDRQFVFVTLETDFETAPPGPAEFSIEAGESTISGATAIAGHSTHSLAPDEGNRGNQYTAEDPKGWIAFPVSDRVTPVTDATLSVAHPALSDGEFRHRVSDQIVSTLHGARPDFDVQSISVPERASVNDKLQITFQVVNNGGDGTFRAAINKSGPSYSAHSITEAIPGDETAEVHFETFLYADGALQIEMELPGEYRAYTVNVE
ncbi:hypothetical protein [Halorhabdus sp. CBA1104]|uniref:hypothetical protein n=1 Tax=Halorhabdus sp. CBA1104 TaxID=1380432 RepID=UPI0012B36A5F|nr:hypothetical protein [Halorhabdus sp. CBA1104]